MATAGICNTFDIIIEGADLNVAKTFVMPRAATVVEITALNTAAGAGTLSVAGSTAGTLTGTTAAPPSAGNGIVQAQSVVGPTAPVTVFVANAALIKGETVTVTASATTITKVVLSCIGVSQAITIS